MTSLGVSTKPEDSIKPKTNHSLEMAKRLFRGGVEISPIPLSLEKTNLGLFSLYLSDRGVIFPLKALYPGNVTKLRSLTAAALLRFWKMAPLWSYPGDYHGSKTLALALSRIAPSSDANHYWGNVHLTDTLLLSHEVFNN